MRTGTAVRILVFRRVDVRPRRTLEREPGPALVAGNALENPPR